MCLYALRQVKPCSLTGVRKWSSLVVYKNPACCPLSPGTQSQAVRAIDCCLSSLSRSTSVTIPQVTGRRQGPDQVLSWSRCPGHCRCPGTGYAGAVSVQPVIACSCARYIAPVAHRPCGIWPSWNS